MKTFSDTIDVKWEKVKMLNLITYYTYLAYMMILVSFVCKDNEENYHSSEHSYFIN